MSMTDRCRGDCCRCFYIQFTPEQLKEEYAKWEAGEHTYRDIEIIAPMLIYRGEFNEAQLVEYCRSRGITPPPSHHGLASDVRGYYYTCRHHQENGDCAIYEERPDMCRGYPYRKRCEYPGCSVDHSSQEVVHQLTRGLGSPSVSSRGLSSRGM